MKKYLIVLFLAVEAFSHVKITSNLLHYNIYPKSKQDLKDELFKKTPILENGKKFLGLTTWKIRFDYKYKKQKNRCKIVKILTKLNVKITLPQIPKVYSVNYNTKSSFSAYYKKLYKHEKNHMKYAIQAAKSVDKKLSSLPSYRNCDLLKKEVNKKSKTIIKRYNKRNKDYDKRTNHGYKEGANINGYI